MKSPVITLSLAVSGIGPSSAVTTASACKMNGNVASRSMAGALIDTGCQCSGPRSPTPAALNWSDVSCFRIPAFAMSILTGRELEFLASLNGNWTRLYRNELARLLHKVDDRCDAHHETHSIIRISAAPSSRSRRNSATTTKT